MLLVSVQNGTGAGRRKPKKNQLKEPWDCKCGRKGLAYFWKSCPACGAKRERS